MPIRVLMIRIPAEHVKQSHRGGAEHAETARISAEGANYNSLGQRPRS